MNRSLNALQGMQSFPEMNGHYFEILSGGPVDVYFFDKDHNDLAIEKAVSAGYYLDRRGGLSAFVGVDIDFGAGQQTIKVFWTDGTGGQKTAPTSVSSAVGPSGTHVVTAQVAGAASAQKLTANAARKYLMVQVDGAQPAGIRVRTDGGVAADAAGSIEILPGQSFVPWVAPVGAITAIRKGGVDINFTVIEGT